jgi:hypothetical protein
VAIEKARGKTIITAFSIFPTLNIFSTKLLNKFGKFINQTKENAKTIFKNIAETVIIVGVLVS